jgi:hypothetical protein
MKRFALGAGLLAAAVAVPWSLTCADDGSSCPKQPTDHCTGACTRGCPKTGTSSSCPSPTCTHDAIECTPSSVSTDHKPVAGVVDDLVAVLAETKSKDVYTAVVVALAHLGTDARPALPEILKNAERLGVLEGAFASGGCKSVQCEVILDSVAAIAHGPDHTHHAHHGYASCPYHHHTTGTDCVLPYPRAMESCDQSSECPKGEHHKPHHHATDSSEYDGLDR